MNEYARLADELRRLINLAEDKAFRHILNKCLFDLAGEYATREFVAAMADIKRPFPGALTHPFVPPGEAPI